MKILSVSHMFLTPHDLMDIVVHRQMRELQRMGHETKVICPIPWTPWFTKLAKPKWRAFSAVPETLVWDGVAACYPRYVAFPRAVLMASSGDRMYQGIRDTVRTVRRSCRFDLVHAHMALPDGGAGLRIAREYEVPLVVTFQATDLDITRKRNKACAKAVEQVFRTAQAVVSPSVRLTREYAKLYGQEPTTVGYGIDPLEVYNGESPLLAQLGGGRILLSVSRLQQSKGIHLVLQALRKLVDCGQYHDLTYLVVGDGPERMGLEALASELGLSACVRFIGMVPHAKVMEYMSLCDVFVLPSWQETFGLVYFEAMAHGKPIVGCRGQGVDGMITEGVSGLLADPRDVESLSDALRLLLDHPEKARAMGQAGRDMTLSRFTWEESAKGLLSVYRHVLSR